MSMQLTDEDAGHAGQNGHPATEARPCPKCGTPTPLRYLKYYRCPDCVVAETRANAAATEAEFARLYGIEQEWGHLMADRKHLLDSLSPDAILTGDGHRALMYRRLAAVLVGTLLGKHKATTADLAWLRDLAWNDSPLIPEDAALIDELASPELPNRNGESP